MKLRRLVLVAVALALPLPAFAQPESASPPLSRLHKEARRSALNLWGWTPPEYMENWEFGINTGEQKTPLYFADLIFPLLRSHSDDRILFFEPRVNHAKSETLFNTGLGYRQLVLHHSWMLGTNLFYDYDTHVSHYRLGTGLEAISSYAEFRANGYLGLSLARTVEPGAAAQIVEKPVDGYDLEFGMPVPYYSRLKLFGGYEWYNFRKFEDREGWSARAEYKPVPFVVLDVTLSDNTKRDIGWGLNVAFRPPFGDNAPEKIRSPLKLDRVIFPDSDVSKRIYSLVERHHEIVVESYSESKGQVTVEVKRGT
ncbi:MAG: inverse autotransporter beta domain-containing protein [Candidatus Omnitrophica bacterium]|nr:inverse autotransporter beta domain-containing protein [Candidatus Omnitrophota bacterium]